MNCIKGAILRWVSHVFGLPDYVRTVEERSQPKMSVSLGTVQDRNPGFCGPFHRIVNMKPAIGCEFHGL